MRWMVFAVSLLYFFKIGIDPLFTLYIVSYSSGIALENGKQGRKHLIIFVKEKEEIRNR